MRRVCVGELAGVSDRRCPGARTYADIANMQQQNQLQANQQALSAMQLLGQTGNQASAAQNAQFQNALGIFGGGGQLQQNVTQQQLDNAQMDFLRRQGLAEQSSTGLFGGTTIPPTLQQASKTTTTSSGK